MLKGPSRHTRARAAAQIKSWASERFGDGAETWVVGETACVTPGAPPRQTVIALIHPAARISFRIPAPPEAITRADIQALGEAAASFAAEACC